MNRDIYSRIWSFSGKAIAILAAVLLVFPTSFSVLCIAPGVHVAIEELNATCCAHPAVSSHGVSLPRDGMDPAGNRGRCTDILLLTNERGAIPKSESGAAAGHSLSAERFGDSLPAGSSPRYFRRSTHDDIIEVPGELPSVPLRC